MDEHVGRARHCFSMSGYSLDISPSGSHVRNLSTQLKSSVPIPFRLLFNDRIRGEYFVALKAGQYLVRSGYSDGPAL